MRITTKSLLIAFAFGLIIYALIDGLRYQNGWGVTMAVVSLFALYVTIRLSRKLARLNEEAGEEE